MRLTTTELADKLGLSKGRISQLVKSGDLAGCYHGSGRERRFDLAKAAAALSRNLDQAQMLGNGAKTAKTLRRIEAGVDDADLAPMSDDAEGEAEDTPRGKARARSDTLIPVGDASRYELARAAKAEEDLRAARLKNGREEGLYVLASEVEQATARMLTQELAQFETALRDMARDVADRLGVDYRTVRKILLDRWRSHRTHRAETLQGIAEQAVPSEAERAEDL